MSLSQSIVVVNEYTIKNSSGKGGSRGGTPGDYILRYMSRDGAIEAGAADRGQAEAYVQDYMAREDAAESIGFDDEPSYRPRRHVKDGVAFGNAGASLSHTELVGSSKDIQAAFDSGKTVMKTVLSFDEEYLRANGIIPEDFVFNQKGDYRGHIDQMKLRYAIMNGMEHLGHDYDDLRYVGVIQVDTAHVHCHLAMADFGTGNLASDGTQRGKLSAQSMAKLRRGVDLFLDEAKEVQFMASSAGLERRSMQTAMKRYTYEQILLYGAPQRIMAALPEDTRLWRAGSNRKEMRQANQICRDYVERIFAKPDSGIGAAMDSIRGYAASRQKREGFDEDTRLKLVSNGREQLVQNCMNSVYSTLKNVPEDQRNTSTPFLEAIQTPMPAPSFKGDVQDFVYRAGAYQSRLSRHREEAKKYAAFAQDYEAAREAGAVDPASQAMYDYFIIERDYQAALASKYSQMLFRGEPDEDYVEDYVRVAEEAKRLNAMRELDADASVRNMKPENAERYGQERYGVYGGRYVVLDRAYFQGRIDTYGKKYEADAAALNAKLAGSGLSLSAIGPDGSVTIQRTPAYDFDSVKGLDLHDLRGDFQGNLEFSGDVRMAYMAMARRRTEAYDRACGYLQGSGQGSLTAVFDAHDVESMRSVLGKLDANEPIEAVPQPVEKQDAKSLIRLDKSMHQYISRLVKQDVVSLELAESYNLREDTQPAQDAGLE